MCKYSKLNLDAFALSCCIAAPNVCTMQHGVQLSAKIFKLSFEYLHIIYSPKKWQFFPKKIAKLHHWHLIKGQIYRKHWNTESWIPCFEYPTVKVRRRPWFAVSAKIIERANLRLLYYLWYQCSPLLRSLIKNPFTGRPTFTVSIKLETAVNAVVVQNPLHLSARSGVVVSCAILRNCRRSKDYITIAIRLRYDYDEKLTCSFFARVEPRRVEAGARDTGTS